ncbi:hypothetical protein K443DRAFT_484925 [Laccaria amethystina LaAM-08-1]|uniref:Uncharacterized protein n=1 Tax=Laccaria amethystina LaAM-08-1 TaxID=1095629 RepID=A0A0C9XZU3_9AGAR|nr:hypothetical protein K443DRAFT_484925 [Laccaria amethystina LaAM-08-1]
MSTTSPASDIRTNDRFYFKALRPSYSYITAYKIPRVSTIHDKQPTQRRTPDLLSVC